MKRTYFPISLKVLNALKECQKLQDSQPLSYLEGYSTCDPKDFDFNISSMEKAKKRSKTQEASNGKQTKKEEVCSDVECDEKKDRKKKRHHVCKKSPEEVKAFFEANRFRGGVTRKELCDFLGFATYETARKFIIENNLVFYLSDVIDLRGSFKPEKELIIPEGASEHEAKSNEAEKEENSNVEVAIVEKNSQANFTVSKGELECNDEKSKVSKASYVISLEASASVVEPKLPNQQDVEKQVNTNKKSKNGDIKTNIEKIFKNIKNYENLYVIGEDVFKINITDFIKVLEIFSNLLIKPIFCIFQKDLDVLDSIKTDLECVLARHFLKFIAQDQDENFSRIIHEEKPQGEELAKWCANHNATYISGDFSQLLICKRYGVKTFVPKVFLNLFPNPLNTNVLKGKIGFDTSAVISMEDQVDFSEYSELVLADIVVDELLDNKEHYVMKVCAYYGKIVTAERNYDTPDKCIIDCYKQNQVDLIVTCDSGFAANSRFFGVKCKLVEDTERTPITPSSIYQSLKNWYPIIDSEIHFNDMSRVFNGKMKLKVSNICYLCDASGKKRKNYDFSYVEYFLNDRIVYKKSGKIIILRVKNVKESIGVLEFFGNENLLPEKLKKYV